MTPPHSVLKQWMQAINMGDIERVVGLYDKHAVLIPTFSNRVLNTHEKLREYFEKLSSRKALSISLHEKTVVVQKLNTQHASLSGIYNWRFMIEGELLNFEARFTYLLDHTKPNPILHHHSSQIPRML